MNCESQNFMPMDLLLIKQHTYSWKGENKVKMIDIEILFGIVLSGAPRS